MTVGQQVRARFRTVPVLVEQGRQSDENLYPFRQGTVVWIHPKGRFIAVQTHTAGGDWTETFRPWEVTV